MSAVAEAQENPRRMAVVGAGITGLSAALRLVQQHDDLRVHIFDASSQAGGSIHTERRDGFLIEHGADAFITNKPGGLQLCRDLGIMDQLIGTDEQHRRSLVVFRGRPVPIPEGFMLMAPAKPMAILTTPILSLSGKLRLLSEAVRLPKLTHHDESLASFVRRRFGSETFDRLVQPLVGGIYTADPEKLSLRATLPRFPEMERQHGSVIRATLRASRSARKQQPTAESGARYGLFMTHADGLSSLVESVVSALNDSGRVQLHLCSRVDSILPSQEIEGGWQLNGNFDCGNSFHGMILATPSWVTARLLNGIDADVAAELEAIEYASTAVVTSTHRLGAFSHPLDAFGLVVPSAEDRKILAVSFSSRKFPGRAPQGAVLMRTFVGGATQPELLELSDEEILDTVASELRDLLGMTEAPLFASVWRHERAMPQYHVGHLDRIDRIVGRMSVLRGLELAGNAYTGVGIPDCIVSGYEAADRLAESAIS